MSKIDLLIECGKDTKDTKDSPHFRILHKKRNLLPVRIKKKKKEYGILEKLSVKKTK